MSDTCTDSTFTGRHEWAVTDDGVRCAFCGRKAPPDVAERMTAIKHDVDEYDRIQKQRKAPGFDRQLAAIAKKGRRKAS